MRGGSILIVDDEAGLRHGLENLFRREGFTVHSAGTYEAALAAAASYPIDAAVLDVRLKGDRSGVDLLRELKRLEPDLAVIIITGYGSVDTAVATLKGGAADYFVKPIDNPKLLEAVRRNLELRALARENRFLRDELAQRCYSHEMVTQDPGVRAILAKADRVKDSPATVLLTGESGTGKEILARYIHFTGNRRDARFVGINCAALSESLLLSELFGHERGAFTGALERKVGKFELADGGTLFLDEIGDMSLDIQAKLLRVIEESGFERLGGVKRIEVDVRVVAATNKDLGALIRAGRFREDLYYRINVVALHLPPLRERPGDVPLLVDHLLDKYCERYGREPLRLPEVLRAALARRSWPGNVRELENVINQYVLLGETSVPGDDAPEPEARGQDAGEPRSLREAVAEVTAREERRIIAACLVRNHGNKSRTARDLFITRKTLAEKIARHGL
jgi:DNA-binding NtrC family response regulator